MTSLPSPGRQYNAWRVSRWKRLRFCSSYRTSSIQSFANLRTVRTVAAREYSGEAIGRAPSPESEIVQSDKYPPPNRSVTARKCSSVPAYRLQPRRGKSPRPITIYLLAGPGGAHVTSSPHTLHFKVYVSLPSTSVYLQASIPASITRARNTRPRRTRRRVQPGGGMNPSHLRSQSLFNLTSTFPPDRSATARKCFSAPAHHLQTRRGKNPRPVTMCALAGSGGAHVRNFSACATFQNRRIPAAHCRPTLNPRARDDGAQHMSPAYTP